MVVRAWRYSSWVVTTATKHSDEQCLLGTSVVRCCVGCCVPSSPLWRCIVSLCLESVEVKLGKTCSQWWKGLLEIDTTLFAETRSKSFANLKLSVLSGYNRSFNVRQY